MDSLVFSSPPPSPVMPLRHRPLLPTKSGVKRLNSPHNYGIISGFRVVSYNILADIYVKTGRYDYHDHCPEECLSWEYRRWNILAEILAYRADIVCLQEVQSDHFLSFLHPQLSRFGYGAIYKRRSSQLYDGEGYTADGCATFFRCNKFNLVRFYDVDYGKIAETMVRRFGLEPRFVKDNLAVVAILEERNGFGTRFCVANTHLNSGKGQSDVRLFQVASLVHGLEKIESLGIPVLVCGDMNSAPNSDTHTFLTKGEVGSFQDVLGFSKFLKLEHSMNLESAYAVAPEEHQNETLDYIMYPKNKMKVDAVLKFPFYECKGRMRQLPTPEWSSDHVALVADFRVRKDHRKRNYSDLPCDPWEELKGVSETEHRPAKKGRMMSHGLPWDAYRYPNRPGFPFAPQLIC